MRNVEILMVDDNPGDVMLLHEAFEDRGSRVVLRFAGDGIEALGILRHGAPRPDLIVLDINMPRMSGLELLAAIKNDPRLRDSTVIVLTGSDVPEERQAAKFLGAVDYCTKPGRLDGWAELSARLENLVLTAR
jgi:CheY-like chemotaxis protein